MSIVLLIFLNKTCLCHSASTKPTNHSVDDIPPPLEREGKPGHLQGLGIDFKLNLALSEFDCFSVNNLVEFSSCLIIRGRIPLLFRLY